MKCIECILFVTAEETGDEPECASGGNVSNPTKNVYCVEMDGDREAWEEEQYEQTKSDEVDFIV